MSGRRTAVVGSGVSGLVAARELHLAGHDVRLFEAGDHFGGHTNTISVPTEGGEVPVDTGFIVLNERNYPNLTRLLRELGVPTQRAGMSFSVSDGHGGFEWTSRAAGLLARPGHVVDPRFHRMLIDLARFNRDARRLVGTNGGGPSMRRFLADRGYSEHFVERLIVPQVSAIWSADPEQLWSFPASYLAEFFHNHGLLRMVGRPRWRSIPGGSRRYVDAIVASLGDRAHLRTPVRRVVRRPGGVDLYLDDAVESFDEVVLAVHSDQALAMLADPSDAEREVLGSIPYQRNETVLHTDESLMPRRRAAWASWNFHLSDREQPGGPAVTYHMNRLQPSLGTGRDFFVTLNRTEAIEPQRIVRAIDYAHPVYTPNGVAAQRRWHEISGVRRTHYSGAYWRWGFHEDGVWSALRAVRALAASPRPLEPSTEPASDPRTEAPEPERLAA